MNEIVRQSEIENRIFKFRNTQVMIDRDLAEMYQVETKVMNQAVRRNIERFPESFRFQLSELELESLRSQSVTLEKGKGQHTKYLPYAFTEQGVAMLSAVLHSSIAIQVSIHIMNAFVQMRKTIGNHQQLLQLSESLTEHKLETNQKFEPVFKALEAPEMQNKQGVFFDGQTYDAYQFINSLIIRAKNNIILIDNYIDDTVITQLTQKQNNVTVNILSKNISKKLQLDIDKANTQYPSFKATTFSKAHDRFIIIDEKEIYHFGASLKDLGKKWFAFSKLDISYVNILDKLKERNFI